MKTPIIAGMATMPSRLLNANRVIQDLLAQGVGLIVVMYNGPHSLHYKQNHFDPLDGSVMWVPNAAAIKVTTNTGRSLDWPGDAGKFFGLFGALEPTNSSEFYYLAVDDDLFYPSNYVEDIIEGVERFGREAAVSYHGGVYTPGPFTSYYRGGRRPTYRCLGSAWEDHMVNNLGTGTLAFHSDIVQPSWRLTDFEIPNMADIWFSILCARARIPMRALKHPEAWITHQDIDHSTTIHSQFRNDEAHIVEVLNANGPYPLFKTRFDDDV